MPARPLVFVAMPFGRKRDPASGIEIDFDAVYENGIKPAIASFDVDSIRADEERGGGVIHRPMFERLLLAEIVIVDVTFRNANVFYELGVRHAARPRSTIIICANEAQLPFDLSLIRTSTYPLEDGKFTDAGAQVLQRVLTEKLKFGLDELEAQDSPLFELIPRFPGISLSHDVTESFRDRVRYAGALRERLHAARRSSGSGQVQEIEAIERELGAITEANADLVVDVILSYRDVAAYDQMIAACERLPVDLRRRMPRLRQQYAFALNRRNRANDRAHAIEILDGVLEQHGESPETCGLLGRVYKDLYRDADAANDAARAAGYLEQAIDAYRRGFTADPRDFFPGVNLVALLAVEGSEESRAELNRLLPTLTFVLSRLGGLASPDYWLRAAVLEVGVLTGDWRTVDHAYARAAGLPDAQPWMFGTTLDNLLLLLRKSASGVDATKLRALVQDVAAHVFEAATAQEMPAIANGVVANLAAEPDAEMIAEVVKRLADRRTAKARDVAVRLAGSVLERVLNDCGAPFSESVVDAMLGLGPEFAAQVAARLGRDSERSPANGSIAERALLIDRLSTGKPS